MKFSFSEAELGAIMGPNKRIQVLWDELDRMLDSPDGEVIISTVNEYRLKEIDENLYMMFLLLNNKHKELEMKRRNRG